MPPSPIMAVTPRTTWVRSKIFMRPCLCIWGRMTSLSPRQRKLRSRQPLPASQTRRSTAIRGSVTPSLGIMGRTTMQRRQRSPTDEQENFYISNFGEVRSSRFGRLERFRAQLRRKQGARAMTQSATPLQVVEETPAYWKVVFDYPPFNMVDATVFEGLQGLLARMDASPSLRVAVFESANPDFYLAHFDLTGKTGNIMTAVGPSGLPVLMDTFVRLTKSSVVSIAKIRGCVRGVSSEFVLACDMRFASRENTRLGQPEVGVGVHPGGGGAERLPHLVGRGRALEIVLGANDFDGDTAERYGYVNRAFPDAELDGFVDTLARRISSFDRRALVAAKNLVNEVSLPPFDRLLDAFTSFGTALTWPEAQRRIETVLERGLQRDADFEKNWPEVLGTLVDTVNKGGSR